MFRRLSVSLVLSAAAAYVTVRIWSRSLHHIVEVVAVGKRLHLCRFLFRFPDRNIQSRCWTSYLVEKPRILAGEVGWPMHRNVELCLCLCLVEMTMMAETNMGRERKATRESGR